MVRKKGVIWFGVRLSPVAAQVLYIASIIGLIGTLISLATTVWAMYESYLLWTLIDPISGEYYAFTLVDWIIPVGVVIILILFFWYNISVCKRAFR